MLILQRRVGESLYIGDDIYVEVLGIENGRVRLAIKAPTEVPILRSELRTAMDANRDAAHEEASPLELLGLLSGVLDAPAAPPGPEPPATGDMRKKQPGRRPAGG